MSIRYWMYRYDAERGGYRRAAGDYTTSRAQVLRYAESFDDVAIYRYDLPANTPDFIESEKLPNGSFIDDLRLQPPGRPIEREGTYRRITLEIREDLLAKIDASGKSRREYIEALLDRKGNETMLGHQETDTIHSRGKLYPWIVTRDPRSRAGEQFEVLADSADHACQYITSTKWISRDSLTAAPAEVQEQK